MNARLAESLVRKWQNVKSQALGPQHNLEELSEVKESHYPDAIKYFHYSMYPHTSLLGF